MEETLKSLFLKLQDVFHPEVGCENTRTKERAKNYPTVPGNLAVSQEDKCVFKSLLSHVEETILKPWSDNQAELLVLTRFEDDDLNQVNCMSVLSSFGFTRGDKTSLEMVKSYIKNHCDQCYPNSPLLMNNLGVMFSENALYEESEDCFNMAKIYCQHEDNIKDAVITLNQAVLKKTLGKYKEAANLATSAASLCDDTSMRTTNYAQLPVKLLGRITDMLQEFGNHQMLKKILRTAVHFDITGADKAVTAVLCRQLMKIQLEGVDKKIEAKEVKDFISHFLTLPAKPDAFKMSMNAELIRTVIQAAKICRNTGQCKDACELLKKLQRILLLVHGENSFLYGSLLYQMGLFLHGSGRFNDAETALKQAEGILICYCVENHHSVALCRKVLGSCILLKGNAKDASEYLNKALTIFKKLSPFHPEVGEILLKLAFLYSEEGLSFQQAQETLQEAEAIFKLSCGEVSCKTANAYFQVGMILQRFKQFRLAAVKKIQKGIDVMLNLGMSLNHPDVMFWSSFLGVLKQSFGMVKEAEKCFTDVQNSVPFCDELGSKEAEIRTSEDWSLHYRDKADDRGDRSSSVKAQVMDQVMTSNGPLGARDWESEGARPKQVSKKGRSEVMQMASEPPVPPFGAFLEESSNDSSLPQGGRVERTSTEMTCQEWLTREQTARKRDEGNDRDMQDAGRRSEEENAGASEQSTEGPKFSETSFVQVVLKEEERREQVVGGSSEQRVRERIKREEREMKEAGSWPQQGGTTYSQQLQENYYNQSTSSSSTTQSDKITVEDMSFVQQGAFLDAKVTGNKPLAARDWESETYKSQQVSKQGLSAVVHIPREPHVPQFGASSVDSSNDSSLSQEQQVERTSSEREQGGQFEREINFQKWIRREQGAGKRGEKKERKIQESKRTSQEENADAVSEQSTESSVFEETSLVKPLLREEAKRDQFVAQNNERRAKERTRKQERVVREAGSWPQQGGTTCSQQLRKNYDNQGALSSSSIQSNKIVEETPLLQQGAFLEEKVTGNRPLGARDWVSEGAKPKQVGKKGRSEVVKIASEPPDPRFGASSVDSSNDSSLSQGRSVERTSRERDQRGQFERKLNCREWKIREQRPAKRGVRREKKMQEAQNRSQDENAACSQQLRDQCSLNTSKPQGGIAENIPLSQQDALADAGRPSAATDRERDGLTDEFLARHTQDMSLRGSLNQSIGTNVSLPPDISAQGTSYTDGYFRDSQNRYHSDPEQSAGQNPTLTPGNLNSAADNENATNDPRGYILNQSVSVSSTDFALGSGTRRQRPIHISSSNAVMSAAEVVAQEDVPVDEPCHGGGNITRGAPIRDYVPESLDITGSSLTWVPHQRDTSQRYSRRVRGTWPIS